MWIGIFWVLTAAVLLGFYALPSKYVVNYTDNNTWGGFWFLSMFVVPVIATFILVDNVVETYAQIPMTIWISVLALSLLWGVGNLLWGISISRIGMALGFSLLIGISTLAGSIIPFFLGDINQLLTPGGIVILAGIAIIALGIIANGKAGLLREKNEQILLENTVVNKSNMKAGIVMCVIGGVCAAGFNLAYHVADNIGNIGNISQDQFGNSPWIARLAVLLPAFIGSGLVTVTYFIFRLTKDKSWGNFKAPHAFKNFSFLLIMAIVYCAAMIIYGLGAYELGPLGTSVGFAIFQSGCIMVANLLGVFTGEWKNAGPQSRKWLNRGLAIICVGILVISYGNSLL